jgi:hypothetical protein
MGLLMLGAIDVPRGCDATIGDLEYILSFAECKIVIVENSSQVNKIIGIKDKLPLVTTLIEFDEPSDKDLAIAGNAGLNLLSFTQIIEKGRAFNAENPNKTSGGRVDPKPRPESFGYFSNANRVAAYQKCAQAIQLRTRLHPEWFAGNPSNAVLGHAQKIRYVQWENVIAVANFDATAAQSYSLPSGTWYNYLDGGTASGTVGLQAGEVKIFTKTQVTLPQINLDLESLLPIENVSQDGKVAAQKILRDGQVMILVGEKVYNLQGQRVR